MKKIVFVNFHPADVHFIKHVARALIERGHFVKFLFSEKENIIEELIVEEGFEYKKLGKIKQTKFLRILSSFMFELRLFFETIRISPDIIFSPTSIYTGIVSKTLHIPLISWADTETATINFKSAMPFLSSLLVSDTFNLQTNEKKTIRYKGYKEIAYLHPNWFTPKTHVLDKLNIKPSDKIVLMRFSALKAMHDFGLKSVADNNKTLLNYIEKIEKYAHVYISMTEKNLDKEFDRFKLKIHPSDYIHLLAHCTLYIGEGTTTASEAGVLGVPWINIQKTTRGYLIDQEFNYYLGKRIDNLEQAFTQALNWITDDEILKKWKEKKEKLLNDKIDVSAFLIWFIDQYPNSKRIIEDDPDYQLRFK